MKRNKLLPPAFLRARSSSFTGVEFLCGPLLLLLGVALIAVSCGDLELEDTADSKFDKGIVTTPGIAPDFRAKERVLLDTIKLYLDKSSGATGFFSVTIRTTAGVFVDSVTVKTSAISNGASWKTFSFSRNAYLERGRKYRIRVLRSKPHNANNDYISWHCSPLGSDSYPAGTNDVAALGYVTDFAFRTYGDGVEDQRQLGTSYSFPTTDAEYRWQEFTVGTEPRVTLNSVQLYFRFGPSVTGDTLRVVIHGLWDGSNPFDSVVSRIKIPISHLQNEAWSTIPIHASLKSGQQYFMHVWRPGVHRPGAGKYFYWCTSDGSADLYPAGYSSVSWTRPVDCAFKTITNYGLDQQQISVLDTARLSSTSTITQTFTPRR